MCRLVIRVWTESVKDEEWTYKEKQVSEMNVWIPVLSFSLFYFFCVCTIFLSELPIVVILINCSPFLIA
jgi:hypothetical protein